MKNETLLLSGDKFYESILAHLKDAKTSVQIECYIFSPGKLADRLCRSLAELAQNGILVEMLIDEVGSPDFKKVYSKDLKKSFSDRVPRERTGLRRGVA